MMLSFVCDDVYPESSVNPGAKTGSPEMADGTGIGAVDDVFVALELVGLNLADMRCLWKALVIDVDFLLLVLDV